MNTRERLMSRASVAVMAAFAPKPEGAADTSKIGQAENVDDAGGDAGPGDGLGLSAEEQAQFEAMQGESGRIAAAPDAGADAGGDAGDGEADGEDEVEAGAATDGPADGAPAEGEQRAPRSISYGKHQRELAKAKKRADDLEARLNGAVEETAREREQRVRLDERTKQLLEAIQARPAAATPDPAAAAAAADPEPDKETDPIGHLEWRNRKLERQVEGLTTGRQQEQQQTMAEREEQQVYRLYEADLARAAQADPSFADAFVHLRETRYRELGFIHADLDIADPAQCARLSPEEQVQLSQDIQRAFYNEQMMVARAALRDKKSPAKRVENLARARGFTPKAPAAPAAAAPAAKNGNGAAAPAVPAARAVAPADAGSVSDQLKAIREGQDASRSLSDAGGSPGGTITPDRLANMSDAEFVDWYDKMPKDQFDRLIMGKPAQQ